MFDIGSRVTLYPATPDLGWPQISGVVIAFDELGPIVRHESKRTGEPMTSLIPTAAIGRIALLEDAL